LSFTIGGSGAKGLGFGAGFLQERLAWVSTTLAREFGWWCSCASVRRITADKVVMNHQVEACLAKNPPVQRLVAIQPTYAPLGFISGFLRILDLFIFVIRFRVHGSTRGVLHTTLAFGFSVWALHLVRFTRHGCRGMRKRSSKGRCLSSSHGVQPAGLRWARLG